MAAVAGKGGAVKIAGTPVITVALVDQWSGDLNQEIYDVTSLGDTWKSDVAGLKKFTGSLSGKWDVTGGAGQTVLHNSMLNGVTVSLDLLTDGVNGYELTAFLTKFSTSNPVNGVVTFNCSFESQGQVYFL
jgi:predicted secreted protein